MTNLKHWVFGHFVSRSRFDVRLMSDIYVLAFASQNPDFTRCAVGPVISRKATNPSVMQVLTVWLIRSFDEVSSLNE